MLHTALTECYPELNQAERRAKNSHHQKQPDLSRAMSAYKKCADLYPDSPFAGMALEKLADFYLRSRDYRRAADLMERVFQDYPDASFLDKMLLKWVVAAYRLQNFQLAKEKIDQFMREYPNSPLADKARRFQKVISRKAD